MQKAFVRQT